MSSGGAKLGIIAGGGDLPMRLAQACRASGRSYFVVALTGQADQDWSAHPHVTHAIGQVGTVVQALRGTACEALVFAGYVKRPDFASLKVDLTGVRHMPAILAAAARGDGALLSAVVRLFEGEGFHVTGADDVLAELVVRPGAAGAHAPDRTAHDDIARAAALIAALGPFDVGQGAVVARGLVLAIEAQEGTDAMLARVAGLPGAVRGTPDAPAGVLVKMPKPGQERRVDLPVIGRETVARAREAGLAGIAVRAGGALIIDRAAVVADADTAGLFIFGFGDDAGR